MRQMREILQVQGPVFSPDGDCMTIRVSEEPSDKTYGMKAKRIVEDCTLFLQNGGYRADMWDGTTIDINPKYCETVTWRELEEKK